MSAIFFYLMVYMVCYFAIHIINLLTMRPLIRNRYMMPLIPVFLVAIAHGYKIVTTSPGQMQDTSMGYALSVFVLMPTVVITLGAVYVMWSKKNNQDGF